MARRKKTETKRAIESYEHRNKQRVNNLPVGLVTPDTDPRPVGTGTGRWTAILIRRFGLVVAAARANPSRCPEATVKPTVTAPQDTCAGAC